MMLLLIIFNNSSSAETILALTEHLPPLQIAGEEMVSGLGVEVVSATLNKAEVDFKIEAHDWSTVYQQTLKESNTCLFSVARMPSREDTFFWVGEVAVLTSSFFTSKNNPALIESVEDAKDFKVAAVKDDVTHHFLVHNGFIEGENLYVHHNYETLHQILHIPSRQIDLIVLSRELNPFRFENVDSYKELFRIKELDLHLNLACNLKTNKGLLEKLKQNMLALEEDGTLNAIRKKWGFETKQ